MQFQAELDDADLQALRENLSSTLSLSLTEAIDIALGLAVANADDPEALNYSKFLDYFDYNALLQKLNQTEQAAFTSALIEQKVLVLPEGEHPLAQATPETLSDAQEEVLQQVEDLVGQNTTKADDQAQELTTYLTMGERRILGRRLNLRGDLRQHLGTIGILLERLKPQIQIHTDQHANPYGAEVHQGEDRSGMSQVARIEYQIERLLQGLTTPKHFLDVETTAVIECLARLRFSGIDELIDTLKQVR